MSANASGGWSTWRGFALLAVGLTFGCERNDSADVEGSATPPSRAASEAPEDQPGSSNLPANQPGSSNQPGSGGIEDHFATLARAAHRKADEAEQTGHGMVAAARELVTVYATAPRSMGPSAAREDLAARAAQLYLRAQLADEARRVAEEALTLRDEPSVTRANLLVVLADAAEQTGKPDAARAYLMDALVMNQKLLDKELETP